MPLPAAAVGRGGRGGGGGGAPPAPFFAALCFHAVWRESGFNDAELENSFNSLLPLLFVWAPRLHTPAEWSRP